MCVIFPPFLVVFVICFFNKGTLFASFHSKGTIPSCSDMLNMCASGILICSTVSFSILGDIPSTPGDLFSFILLILQATTSGVTTNCPNLSPSDPLNFVSGTGNELVLVLLFQRCLRVLSVRIASTISNTLVALVGSNTC